MKKPTDNQLRWILVIGLIILPIVFIRFASDEIIPRLISIILLLTLFPGTFLFLALNPNEKPISTAPRLKGKYSEKILRKWDIAFKLFAITMIGLIFYYATIPLLCGTYRLIIKHESLIVVDQTIQDLNSGLFDPFSLIWTSIKTKEQKDESYSLWYPSHQMRVGERYRFTILPGTKVVLNSERIE